MAIFKVLTPFHGIVEHKDFYETYEGEAGSERVTFLQENGWIAKDSSDEESSTGKVTKKALQEQLKEAGIDYPAKATLDELQALVDSIGA